MRRLTENEEWLGRCDRWEAQSKSAIEGLTSRRP